MNRKYDVSLFDSRVRKIKSLMPAACIAADVIVGFPGESAEDFEETLTYIRNAPLSYVHVFTYSSRPGTKASAMERIVSPEESKRRSEILHRLSDEKKSRFYRDHLGKTASVLFESDNHSGYIQGWTENYLRAKTSFDPFLVNDIVTVRLDKLDDDHVFTCEIINKKP
jgi:threonylcarbamoyladenosine tRNA methylthiotransferase MtaB